MVGDLARFLDGAGGYVEQTHAYLEQESARDYLALCQQSIAVSDLRARMPLAQAARQIVAASGSDALQVLGLGSGDGILETNLVRHLIDVQAPRVELCLLDISQPLLTRAYHHAAETLASVAQAQVLAIQCNFHHMPLFAQLYASRTSGQRRLFCMLGGTLANLDQEPRFLRHSLLGCQDGDLLLLDIPTARASCDLPEEIQRLDPLCSGGLPPAHAGWLEGPILRHCKDVASVEFSLCMDTHCPVPGSYALHAIAMVKSAKRADRRFSMFRFGRYEPTALAQCLSEIGWHEIGAIDYAGEHSLRLYQNRTDDRVAGAR